MTSQSLAPVADVQLEKLTQAEREALLAAQSHFRVVASRFSLDWKSEMLFAAQALLENDYLSRYAKGNPVSLTMAMMNVASIGLTLNPARGQAYLVGRDGKVILDVSYRGLIQLAVDDGAIVWAQAELVRENDLPKFRWKGPAAMPDHDFNPFDTDRGEIVGGYCVVETPTGHILAEAMSVSDIYQARNKSKMWQVEKEKGPWVEFEERMMKKTLIKRGSQTWPRPSARMAQAVQYLNRDLGEGLATLAVPEEKVIPTDDQVPPKVLSWTKRVIDRARETGAWLTAEDLVAERLSDVWLLWARQKLQQAREDTAILEVEGSA